MFSLFWFGAEKLAADPTPPYYNFLAEKFLFKGKYVGLQLWDSICAYYTLYSLTLKGIVKAGKHSKLINLRMLAYCTNTMLIMLQSHLGKLNYYESVQCTCDIFAIDVVALQMVIVSASTHSQLAFSESLWWVKTVIKQR